MNVWSTGTVTEHDMTQLILGYGRSLAEHDSLPAGKKVRPVEVPSRPIGIDFDIRTISRAFGPRTR